MLLKDRVVLVTGSGRGIGRAIAHRSAAEGAAVFLCARSEAELASAAAEIGKTGDVGFAVADLTKEEDCARVVAAAARKGRWHSGFAGIPCERQLYPAGRRRKALLHHCPPEAAPTSCRSK